MQCVYLWAFIEFDYNLILSWNCYLLHAYYNKLLFFNSVMYGSLLVQSRATRPILITQTKYDNSWSTHWFSQPSVGCWSRSWSVIYLFTHAVLILDLKKVLNRVYHSFMSNWRSLVTIKINVGYSTKITKTLKDWLFWFQ